MAKVKTSVAESTTSPENLVRYQEIDLYMIFENKLRSNFRRKARLFAGRHMTNAPIPITYSSVVLRDSVSICLLIAALND